ncbi:MAG: ATP-binding protein, partial [Gemmatimonadota bacterium]
RQWEPAVAAFEAARAAAGGAAGELAFWHGMALRQTGRVVEAEEALEEAAETGHGEARYQVAQLYAQQSRGRPERRQRAIRHLAALLEAGETDTLKAGLDRVCFALGGLYAEEDGRLPEALAAHRRGLGLNPLSAAGHNSLGTLLMQSGQILGAVGEFKVAIQLDPEFHGAYANLARLLFKHVKPGELAEEYEHVCEDFGERAPQVLARLSLELVELGRQQVYEGMYTKGHQLKNLMGVVGSRLRRCTRRLNEGAAPAGEGPWGTAAAAELTAVAAEHERLYEEWVGYLSAMTPDRLHPTLFEPARVVRRVVEAVQSQAGASQVSLRVQEGLPRVEADERLLREVVTNLCINALEALTEQGGEVVLGVGYDAARGVVYIEVEDNGPGIPPELLEHVFDPGFTTKEQGNGYGLTIARRIAQAHHGQLRVKSLVGHGTVFRLDLPVNFEADTNPESLSGTNL